MHPENFRWLPTRDPGFELKHLGTFGERALNIGQIRATRGARHLIDRHRAPDFFRRAGRDSR